MLLYVQLLRTVDFRIRMNTCHARLTAQLDTHFICLTQCARDPERAGLTYQVRRRGAFGLSAALHAR